MTKLLDERYEFQRNFIDYLVNENGYRKRSDHDFDRRYAMDTELLFEFLNTTQPEEMEELRKIYKGDLEATLVNFINNEITKKGGSLIDTLKNGVEIGNRKIELMYTKPATDFNRELIEKYQGNIFSVMEEVRPNDKERVDLVIFLNGFAIVAIELKSEYSGQSYEDAIRQYREHRDPQSRLFLWKAGCIVCFAMDSSEVYMTTRLDREQTFFLPFNMGRGEGIDAGAGNPIYDDKLSVAYMWEDILTRDTLLDLISKFIFIEQKEDEDNVTGKRKIRETVIFPRYHQLDLIRKLIADVKVNRTSQNYLIQHSAGSGKTNSIAWLAHRLVSLHDAENQVIYDTIIIITDRVVVDRQLQRAVQQIDHDHGLIEVMGNHSTSEDLRRALESNTKIVGSTIQKFPYIVEELKNMRHKNFAVLIDEAHSSTAGRNMLAVTRALSSDASEFEDAEDYLAHELSHTGKQPNVSMFAFTATPKPTTLRMFGRLNKSGQFEAFHLYSMKQAIEEGFILNVLANYTTYDTMYRINKAIDEDPELKTSAAKRQIARFVELNDVNIAQRVEVIIEHFRNHVMEGLGGQAKAMVVTPSREAAVKYRQAFEKYIEEKGYEDIHTLVAFSGKVKLRDEGNDAEYTEVSMNKMPEEDVPRAFDSDVYNVMIVANKYQTGFDQKKLCAMYIMKNLRGVNAVQTLSRLNRVCPPYDKQVFVLDFVNDYYDMKDAFAPYYSTTFLASDLSPNAIKNLIANIDGYAVILRADVDQFYDLLFKERQKRISAAEKQALRAYLARAARLMESYSEPDQREFVSRLRNFKRFYEFLIQVSCFEDPEVHKFYVFVSYFLQYVDIGKGGKGFDLTGKIEASHFSQRKGETHTQEKQPSKPVVKLPVADGFSLTDEKLERLSEIIRDINSRTGSDFNLDVATKAAYQIRDIMLASDELKTSARNNSEDDFLFSYYSNVEDALVKGLDQNQEFFTLLLNDTDTQRELLGVFATDIYKSLRASQGEYR